MITRAMSSPIRRRPKAHIAAVALAVIAGLALPGSAMPAYAESPDPTPNPSPSAQARELAAPEAGEFSTSFEADDAAAFPSRVEMDADGAALQTNVEGESATSLRSSIESTTASVENAPGETAAKVTDGDGGSKWLAFAPAAWLQIDLKEPATAVTYALTAGNDAAERDPRDWRLLGSTDGVDFVEVDTQSAQTWDPKARGATTSYTIATPGEYTQYRLDISANQSGGLLQLAEWDLQVAPTDDTPNSPMTTAIASGPASGYNMKPLVGFTGVQSLTYGGRHSAEGPASATNRLFDVNVPIGDDSRLSYLIFPALTANDLQYPSTHVAIDLGFSDGTAMSGLRPKDAYDTPATASGQGRGSILYPNQWNRVQVDLGQIAAGKTVSSIRLSYDNAGGTAATAFQGWVDDIAIAPAAPRIDDASLTNYVDTRRGTNSSGSFSRGSNEAITSVPNGFNFLVPVTNALAQSREYSYQAGNNDQNRPTLEGLGISHQPSPWMGDRNQFSVMPVDGVAVPSGNPDQRAVPFSHDNETAQPDYYGVTLDNKVTAEMTPTNRGMLMRFTLPSGSGSVVLDSPTGDGAFAIDPATGAVSGWIDRAGGFRDGQTRMFISGTFDQVPTAAGIAVGGRALTIYASFDTGEISLRVATSLISLEQAAKNLALEVADADFDDIRAAARAEWNDRLGVVQVDGATDTELVTLYGSLYRLNVYPNAQFENAGTAEAPDYQYASPVSAPAGDDTDVRTGATIVPGKMYVNNGFWDTYRTTWPAYSLLYPEVAAELVDGFTQQYRDGGWVARWSSPGYANIMTGTSSDVAFADAYLRGVDLPDALATYDAAVKNASTPSGSQNIGRKSIDTSLFLGYTPATQGESVSWATEGYINDFGIGNMAAALADDPKTPDARRDRLREESKYYLDRALNYVNMFDPAIDFLQARNADGSFVVAPDEYDPTVWFGPYTETNGWNFSFHAPQDPNGLANLYGDRQGLEDKLDAFFALPETSLGPIHEEVEARDGRFGQWGVSNQVSHHIPFMYNAAGAPAKAQAITREALRRSFTGSEIGQGYPGDEDNGEMSAWYLFSALGLYPMQTGSSELVVGSPLFEKATVRLAGDKELVINAPGNDTESVYVQSLKVDGKDYSSTSIDSNTLIDGATLDFTMGDSPSSWGTAAEDAPPSLTTGDEVATPVVDTANRLISTATSGGKAIPQLVDDSSATEAALTSPEVTIGYDGAKQKPTFYTVTAASTESDPSAWVLEGSDDGETWSTLDERSDVVFANRRQTEPFPIEKPATFQQFRLSFTDGATTIALAEVQLLSPGAGSEGGDFAFDDASGLTATAGAESTLRLGTLSGGEVSAGASATIDWGDGTPPADATIGAVTLGNLPVSAAHTFAEPGVYRASISATDGTTTVAGSAMITVGYLDPSSLRAAFDSVCLGDDGVGADCDAKGLSFPRKGLADGGLTQGIEASVPGTELRFTLPVVPAGQPDNATGRGQVIALDLGDGATSLSFIGAATERDQDEVATVTFADGSSAETPLQFSDWTKRGDASAIAPFGNIEVAKADYRLVGGSASATPSFLFSTVPYEIPAGKTVASVTMPIQEGQPGTTGRVHVFGIASDGATAPSQSFAATAGESILTTVDAPVDAVLATIEQSDPSVEPPLARVQWGDASATEAAVVSSNDGRLEVSSTHSYAKPGDYTVSVTVYNAEMTTQLQLTATVSSEHPIVNTAPPTVTGTAKVGSVLTVDTGSWDAPRPTFTYQWMLDDAPIEGSTDASYTVQASNAGRTLSVTVVASADDVGSTSVTTDGVIVAKVQTRVSGKASRFVSFGGGNVTYSGVVAASDLTIAGKVTIYDGSHAIATAEIGNGGRYSVSVPKLGRGIHVLSVRFAGDEQLAPARGGKNVVAVW